MFVCSKILVSGKERSLKGKKRDWNTHTKNYKDHIQTYTLAQTKKYGPIYGNICKGQCLTDRISVVWSLDRNIHPHNKSCDADIFIGGGDERVKVMVSVPESYPIPQRCGFCDKMRFLV